MPNKIGLNTTQRMALIKNQASSLLWYGKIETTKARAKEVQKYVEKIITLAMNTYEDTIESTVTSTNEKGKEVTKTVIKDGVKKLAARRRMMSKLNDLQEIKAKSESKAEFRARTADVKHPLIEKIFNELAPKYAARKEELGQGGGYTRIYLLGNRRGDAAEVAIIELI